MGWGGLRLEKGGFIQQSAFKKAPDTKNKRNNFTATIQQLTFVRQRDGRSIATVTDFYCTVKPCRKQLSINC